MITLNFQTLDNYTKKETDVVAMQELLQKFLEKYPKLFEGKEMVADVRVSVERKSMQYTVTFVCIIPSFGKVFAEAREQTYSQAVSSLKKDLDRSFRDLAKQFK